MTEQTFNPDDILAKAESLRGTLSTGFRDEIVKSLYSEAETIAKRAVKTVLDKKYDFDQKIDRLVTSPIVGLPIMLILLSLIIWLTVSGANVASAIGDAHYSIKSACHGGSLASSGMESIWDWHGLSA
jgi:ferrous iron transport protein B